MLTFFYFYCWGIGSSKTSPFVALSFDTINFISSTLFIVTLLTPTKLTVGALVYSPSLVYWDTSNWALKFASVRLFISSSNPITSIVILFLSGTIDIPSCWPIIE